MRATVLAIGLVLAMTSRSVLAGPFEDAATAAARGDRAEALRILQKAADNGTDDPRIHVELALAFATGRDVPRDDGAAVAWFRKAADRGHHGAWTNLGFMYATGRGVAADYAEALSWYRKAAAQGHATAQNNIAYMYATGRGVPKDYAEALSWYRKAADQGLTAAQYNLGFLYRHAQEKWGATDKRGESNDWYQRAAKAGDASARNVLGVEALYAYGASAAYRQAADLGFATAQNNLGFLYASGLYTVVTAKGSEASKDEAQALALFRKAAAQDIVAADSNLGFMSANGRGVARDHVEALARYRKAADRGDAGGQNNLGYMHAKGIGVPRDHAAAAAWFRKAADQGLAAAQYNLGFLYGNGQGVPRDDMQAFIWFKLAADRVVIWKAGTRWQAASNLRDRVAHRLTDEQRQEAEKRARLWVSPSAAVASDGEALDRSSAADHDRLVVAPPAAAGTFAARHPQQVEVMTETFLDTGPLWVHVLFVLAIPGMAVFLAGWMLMQRLKGRTWLNAAGTIVEAELEVAGRRTSPTSLIQIPHYTPRLQYQYEVGGRRYTGRRIAASDHGIDIGLPRPGLDFPAEQPARAMLDRYPQGGAIRVFYDPADPSQSALETRIPGQIEKWLAIAALAVAGPTFMYFIDSFNRLQGYL